MTHRLVFVLRRRPALSREEFQRYWLEEHAPLVRRSAAELGVARYQQAHTELDDDTYGGLSFDGVAELWFGGRPEATASAAAARLLADEREFIDLASSPIFLARENVVVDGPSNGMRMTTLLYRKAGTTLGEFREYWSEIHAPIALRHGATLGTLRYVQMSPEVEPAGFPPAVERGAPEAPDGFGESYFDPDAMDAARLGDALNELTDDAAFFVDTERTVSAFGRVIPIIG